MPGSLCDAWFGRVHTKTTFTSCAVESDQGRSNAPGVPPLKPSWHTECSGSADPQHALWHRMREPLWRRVPTITALVAARGLRKQIRAPAAIRVAAASTDATAASSAPTGVGGLGGGPGGHERGRMQSAGADGPHTVPGAELQLWKLGRCRPPVARRGVMPRGWKGNRVAETADAAAKAAGGASTQALRR